MAVAGRLLSVVAAGILVEARAGLIGVWVAVVSTPVVVDAVRIVVVGVGVALTVFEVVGARSVLVVTAVAFVVVESRVWLVVKQFVCFFSPQFFCDYVRWCECVC